MQTPKTDSPARMNAPGIKAKNASPALIALDWGTSNLRASLLGGDGTALETRSAPGGIMAVKDALFAAPLMALCGDWIAQTPCPLIASGMIGSRQGWKEAPYFGCPATLAHVATQLTTVDISAANGHALARQLHIVGGLKCVDSSGEFDVMRGEEVQIWGAGLAAHSCCVLPGTHSKWAWLGDSAQVSCFKTFMTGELFAVLTKHSILGRLMNLDCGASGFDTNAFSAGVQLALRDPAQMTHTLFAVRTAGLMGRVAPESLPDYLSGLLIGAEIAGATLAQKPKHGITLIGEDALCLRYTLALALAGIPSTQAAPGATTRGQWMIAKAAGLV